jgi:maltooligosyltrehalose synthase
MAGWTDGRVKMLLTACGLRFRRRHERFMATASYEPLVVEGPRADQVVAFMRERDERDGGRLIVIVPRLVAGITSGQLLRCVEMPPGSPADVWHDTRVRLPARCGAPPVASAHARSRLRHIVTGEDVAIEDGDAPYILVTRAFATMPVAVLWAPME